jgi:protein-L-isoaspartate(D-aspartate) O-methyltransferase
MAHCVGPSGRVVAIVADAALADEARRNLLARPWVEVRHGDGTDWVREPYDAVLVNAGVTHPRGEWLDGASAAGRIVLPMTATGPAMGAIGKGPMILLSIASDGSWSARVLTLVAIYSALGLRDETLNAAIGDALRGNPLPPLKRLRLDAHARAPACWLHGAAFCLST